MKHYVYHEEHKIGTIDLPIRGTLLQDFIRTQGTEGIELKTSDGIFKVLVQDLQDYSIRRNTIGLLKSKD